jgi:uncharacterized protein (TIGR03435 family)
METSASFEARSAPSSYSTAGSSIFTAFQEIGLKLESSKLPVEVLLIDSVRKPTEN